jgi:DNA-binding NarL/FixJ family response regulator
MVTPLESLSNGVNKGEIIMKTLKAGTKTKKNKVFIVEDHCILREGLTHLINSEDDLVVCGEIDNVTNALQAIENAKPDIVVVDISLADGNGIRLTENLIYSNPGLLVLVLSMHDESEYAERCLKSGACCQQ